MAKVGLWLRGARGKLAGTVFSKGENGTVARELVTPANKQTTAQMRQRVAFATISKAATFMLAVIGMSFKGATSVKVNRREFLARNINELKAAFAAYEEGSTTVAAKSARAVAKGYSMLIPNRYIISNGSLALPAWLVATETYSETEHKIKMSLTNLESVDYNVGEVITAAKIVNDVMGVQAGQQITLCGIYTKNGSNVLSLAGSLDFMRYARFVTARIVFLEGAGNSITVATTTTAQNVKDCIASLIDNSKSDAAAVAALLAGIASEVAENALTITPSVKADTILKAAVPTNEETMAAFGAIVSEFKNNNWDYSQSRMAVAVDDITGVSEDGSYGLLYEDAAPTYKASASQINSEFYTQQGGQQNSIG